MTIDNNKWIDTLPISKTKNYENNEMNAEVWVNTIAKKKNENPYKKNSLSIALFITVIIGLIFIPVIKNQTRDLQKEINNLRTSINAIEENLHHAVLDHQFITSPENITLLAKEHLEANLFHYKKYQISNLNNDGLGIFSSSDENYNKKNSKKHNNNLTKKIKLEMISKIEEKKIELRKLQEIYSKPEKLPEEIKMSVAKKIEKTKLDLEKLYYKPTEVINLQKIQKWGAVQLVKVFLGIPIVPGR